MPSPGVRDLGMQLGQYWIERRLGGDLSPEVTRDRLVSGLYLARDTELNLEVVLRILPRGFSDPARMQRIVQRTNAAFALKHRNVATIYEIGAASGEWFVATEYVQGEPLHARTGGYPLSAADIAGIAIQVADALIHAHGRGIVHGDITPSNIMVSPGGQVKLVNFGLGRELTDDMLDWPEWTDMMLLEFVRYISPEQLYPREEDSRSDLFSLGIVLYEIATGRHPFPGQDPPLAEYSHFIRARITREKPDAITRLNAKVPAELERIIHQCLEKDLERRYQSACDLAVDLKNIDDNMGTRSVQTQKL